MSQLPIYNCFHPILREKSIDIVELNDEINQFIKDLLETMDKADGAGLAANQVGSRHSIIAIDQQLDKNEPGKPLVMINPKITSFGERQVPFKEGCLSIPGYYESVVRPDEIEVSFLDTKLKEHKQVVVGRPSRIIQHEVDHINGLLFTDRLSTLKKTLAKKGLKKVEKLDFYAYYPMMNPDGTIRIADEREDED
jgi:peptide deformylase